MGFFDFTADLPQFERQTYPEVRLNTRYEMLVLPFAEKIQGAHVLDLGAKDGRWCYAFAAGGAAKIVAAEPRREIAAMVANFPNPAWRDAIEWRHQDVYAAMEAAAEAGETFDIITAFSTLTNVTDPIRLGGLIAALRPQLVLLDGDFIQRDDTVLRVIRARSPGAGKDEPLATVPSKGAMELIAGVNGYDVEWLDWDRVPLPDRAFIRDYYVKKRMRRETAILRQRL